MNALGKLAPEDLCQALDCTRPELEDAMRRLGLSPSRRTHELAWCDRCATWRTRLNARTGFCRVCTMHEQLSRCEDACAEALALLSPSDRAVYENSEAERQTRRLPPHPAKRRLELFPDGMCSEDEARYQAEMEKWEHRVLKLRYDAAKTRLRRMREKSGTNPRKSRGENK